MQARITSKGQVTIPKKVRQALGLHPGDELEFILEGQGVRIYPRRRYRAADLPRLVRGSRLPFAGHEAEAEALAQALREKEARIVSESGK
jgi:AbrB family looped-hinge helix DNA binding protein